MSGLTSIYPPFLASAAFPGRMAVQARLHGFTAPPPGRCRVLELGCGTGWSLLAFGSVLPGSEFHGIDLSAPAIAQGQELVHRLGLSNVHLRHGDVMEIGEADGQFDFIFAHGLLSWVPEPARRKLFEICRDRLASNGVAYLSYNAYPGSHMREMLSGMLQFHTRSFTSDTDRMMQAYGLMRALVEPPVPDAPYQQYLLKLNERMSDRHPELILFDELAEVNHPYYFHEVVALAAAHGLEFLSEADFTDFSATLPQGSQAILAGIGDRIAREQYLDFFIGRAFRMTLLCRTGQQRPLSGPAEALQGLSISGPMEAVTVAAGGTPKWTGAGGAAIATGLPAAQAAFARLGASWPGVIPAGELLAHASSPEEAGVLATILYRCVRSGLLRAHVEEPPVSREAGVRPRASALARAQIGERFVPNLSCEAIRLSNEGHERLLALLDGSRTVPELAAALNTSEAELAATLRTFVNLELIQESETAHVR